MLHFDISLLVAEENSNSAGYCLFPFRVRDKERESKGQEPSALRLQNVSYSLFFTRQ